MIPPRLTSIPPAAIARRLELHPETVTLEAVKEIITALSAGAEADGHMVLRETALEVAESVQELIDGPAPDGLEASARMIAAVDAVIESAQSLRFDTAASYDRLDRHTSQATEALEILIAYGTMLEAADFDLRTGTRTR